MRTTCTCEISKQYFMSPHVYCDIRPKSRKQQFAVYKINLNSTRHSQTCITRWPNLKAKFMLGCLFQATMGQIWILLLWLKRYSGPLKANGDRWIYRMQFLSAYHSLLGKEKSNISCVSVQCKNVLILKPLHCMCFPFTTG